MLHADTATASETRLASNSKGGNGAIRRRQRKRWWLLSGNTKVWRRGRQETEDRRQRHYSPSLHGGRTRGTSTAKSLRETCSLILQSSVTVEEIDSVNDLASRFYRIELPSQLASTLSNPLLRKVVALRQPGALFHFPSEDTHANMPQKTLQAE